MSDYGLKIINASGETQIDSIYKNHCLLDSGVTALDVSANSFQEVDFINTTKVPIVAWRPNSSWGSAYVGLKKSGANFIDAWFLSQHDSGGGSNSIAWIVFVSGNVNATSCGLVVYNSNGEVVFSSDDNYMRIQSVYTGSLGNISVKDADNNYFILMPVFPMRYVGGGIPDQLIVFFTMGLKKVNSTTISVEEFIFGGADNPFYITGGFIPSTCTLIEVNI